MFRTATVLLQSRTLTILSKYFYIGMSSDKLIYPGLKSNTFCVIVP